jgi:hypothetical protein
MQIPQQDDAHQMHLVVQYGQPANAPPLHESGGGIDVQIFTAKNGRDHHDFPDPSVQWVATLCSGSNGYIAYGEQPHHLRSLTNREYRDVVTCHFACGFLQQSVWTNHLRFFSHNVLELHSSLSARISRDAALDIRQPDIAILYMGIISSFWRSQATGQIAHSALG